MQPNINGKIIQMATKPPTRCNISNYVNEIGPPNPLAYQHLTMKFCHMGHPPLPTTHLLRRFAYPPGLGSRPMDGATPRSLGGLFHGKSQFFIG